MRKVALAVALFAIGVAAQARAASFSLTLNIHFGSDPAAGSVAMTVADVVGAVRITMDATGLATDEDVTEWYFNISDPLVGLGSLSAAYVSGNIDTTNTSVSFGSNAFMADGDGDFDVLFDFPPPGMNRFDGGEIVVYDISGDPDLDALDFLAFSSMGGGQGVYISAAKIQSTNCVTAGCGDPGDLRDDNEGSDFLGAVPEPGALALFSTGLIVAGVLMQRSRRR
jgi:hypothetical protein